MKNINVKTRPYPGFPTDMQPQMTALLCFAKGDSKVTEGVWDNRFRYIEELRKTGASIDIAGETAIVHGGATELVGAPMRSVDLRAGAAMVIAGLAAEGTTVVSDIKYVERGYENITAKLRGIGADFTKVEIDEPMLTVVSAG